MHSLSAAAGERYPPRREEVLASLLVRRRTGHEMELLDASAPFVPRGHDEIAERALAFRADASFAGHGVRHGFDCSRKRSAS
jgi:hypothetical protein